MRIKKTSDYVKLQRSREARLWLTTVLAVGVSAATYLDNHPEVKEKLRDKTESFLNRFRKNPQIRCCPPTNKQ